MSTKFDVESAIKIFKQEADERGDFSIIDKGFEILPAEYIDFWRWLFDDRDFFENDVLSKVAGYVASGEMRNNKARLYDYVKSSVIGAEWELPELFFCQKVPLCSYEEYRKKVAAEVEKKKQMQWEQLCEWSEGFHKFVCVPLSEKFLITRNKRELQLFLHSIDCKELKKAFVLYSHEARIQLLHCYSDRMKREILSDMKAYSKAGILSLTECVEAESTVYNVIEQYWRFEIGECLEEYMQERKAIIDTVKETSGEKHFMIPNILGVKRCDGGIMLTIKPVNIDYVGMTHVYDIDWRFPITKYAFIFYRYVLAGKGKVIIDIEGRKELPAYDFLNNCKQGDYFLFLYRLLKLEKCYQWIVLSDIIKKAVHTFEQDLLNMFGSTESFFRLADKQPYRKPVRPLNYHEKVQDGLFSSGIVMDVLGTASGKQWINEDIKREFRVNLYHGEVKGKNRCFEAEVIDFWGIQNDTFYGMNLCWNVYDSMIEKVFFYANYLSDVLSGGLFENVSQTDKELLDIKKVLLLVLMTEQQGNVFFKDWLKFSEQVVEKVRIMWRNV